jgi:hypothetical protein
VHQENAVTNICIQFFCFALTASGAFVSILTEELSTKNKKYSLGGKIDLEIRTLFLTGLDWNHYRGDPERMVLGNIGKFQPAYDKHSGYWGTSK